MKNPKSFVVGSKSYPDWFKEQASKGRARVNYGDEGELVNITIYGATKNYTAIPGDEIIFTKSGMSVVNKEVEEDE